MSDLPVTFLDLGVIVVVLLSAIVALSRGAVREVMALLTWIVAFIVAYGAFEPTRPIVAQAISNELFAALTTAAVVFLVPFVILRIIGGMLARSISGGALGTVDKGLGLLFGIVRGVAIVAVAYFIASELIAPEKQPLWVKEAVARPGLERSRVIIENILPGEMVGASATAEIPLEDGYSREQRERLDDLIGSAAGGE